MWRGAPPPIVFLIAFVGLGPPVGGLVAFLLMPFGGDIGPDKPSDVATIMAWGAYIVGLLPALVTGVTARLMWGLRTPPLPYVVVCCGVGGAAAAAMVVPLLALGTVDPEHEAAKLAVFMATCGAAAALLPALVTLPAAVPREG